MLLPLGTWPAPLPLAAAAVLWSHASPWRQALLRAAGLCTGAVAPMLAPLLMPLATLAFWVVSELQVSLRAALALKDSGTWVFVRLSTVAPLAAGEGA